MSLILYHLIIVQIQMKLFPPFTSQWLREQPQEFHQLLLNSLLQGQLPQLLLLFLPIQLQVWFTRIELLVQELLLGLQQQLILLLLQLQQDWPMLQFWVQGRPFLLKGWLELIVFSMISQSIRFQQIFCEIQRLMLFSLGEIFPLLFGLPLLVIQIPSFSYLLSLEFLLVCWEFQLFFILLAYLSLLLIYFLYPSRKPLLFIGQSFLLFSLGLLLIFSMFSSPQYLPSFSIFALLAFIHSFYCLQLIFEELVQQAMLSFALCLGKYEFLLFPISSFGKVNLFQGLEPTFEVYQFQNSRFQKVGILVQIMVQSIKQIFSYPFLIYYRHFCCCFGEGQTSVAVANLRYHPIEVELSLSWSSGLRG